jgi:hypothetical protein
MRAYLVKMCNMDGSTPLGECPEYEIEVEDTQDMHDARHKATTLHPEQEVVSIGLKSEILAYEKRYNLARGEV